MTRSFTIITTDAGPDVAELHERMPVVLEPTDWPVWLGEAPGDLASFVAPITGRHAADVAGGSSGEQPEEQWTGIVGGGGFELPCATRREIARMTLIEIPTLTTNRLRLRAFRADDLDAFAAMRANPEVVRYLGSGRTSTPAEVWRTMATFLGQWALRGYGMWACEKIDSGVFIGSVGIFHPLDWPEPEMIYSLDGPFWRQGFATEAAGAARDWLFEHFPLPQAASFIRPENQASKRVAERLGAVYERTFEWRGSNYERWVHYRTDPRS